MIALALVAVSLGLDNFAAAVGIGAGRVDARTRLLVGAVFGLFEAGMPVLGLLLGHGLSDTLGQATHWIGAGLLIATGGYAVIQALRDQPSGRRQEHTGAGRLLVTGAALSIDNLTVGFALGTLHVSLALAAIVIGAVSVALSLAGLELGHRIAPRLGERGELIGGLVLIAVGIAVATGLT